MSIINTGSWYQLLLKRRGTPEYIPSAPIAWFNVTSDILNFKTTLSVENIKETFDLDFSVINLDTKPNVVFSIENIEERVRMILSVQNLDIESRIIFSAENID